MGATGHVGGAVARALLAADRDVTVLTRDPERAAHLRDSGAQVAELDVHKVDTLRCAFRRGRRAFLLNPPADPSSDTDREESITVRAILDALLDSGLETVVAASTYGAQPGDRVGDLSVLYGLEAGLTAQSIPATIVRSAYYFSNLDALVEPAREGALPTMLPDELSLPMIAPEDIGRAAAKLLMEPLPERRTVYVEGPDRYSFADVARAFATALHRQVVPVVTPPERWESELQKLGFSKEAAHAYANMTRATVEGDFTVPGAPLRGDTTLQQYVDALVARC
jgi:uncharacterized protein YbjT (DUF2867 family)